MSSANETKQWWQGLPAILTGLAAVIASLATLIPVLRDEGADEPPKGPPGIESQIEADADRADSDGTDTTPPGLGVVAGTTLVDTAVDTATVDTPSDTLGGDPAAEEATASFCGPCRVALRVKTRDSTPSEIVIAFTDSDPSELVHAANPDHLIRQKFTFSGRSGRWSTFSTEEIVDDGGFLDARHVVVYNEGSNGWDGWVQLKVDDRLVVEERITDDLKNFRKPENDNHRYWAKVLNVDA